MGRKKRGTLLLSMSLAIIDRYSKCFHWHTLQAIFNNIIIIIISHHTVNASLHYLVKYKCKQKLMIITKIKVNEKTLQTNIVIFTMNDPYDTRVC